MAPSRSSGFVDPGWEHGIAQDERKKKVKCNYCGKIVSGGVYRLKQHLARVSGEVTYCDKAPEEVYLSMRENLEGRRSNKKPRECEDEGHAYLNFHSNDDEEEGLHAVSGNRGKGKQLIGNRNFTGSLTPLRSLGYVDPGWDHGVAQDEKKKKVKCNYCEKIVSGGINRFKQHLARIPGEVAPCKHAPEDVYLKIKDNMKWHRTGRRTRGPDSKEKSVFYMHSEYEDEEDEQEEASLHHMNKERQEADSDKRLCKDLRSTFRGMSSGGGSEPLLKRSRLDSVFLKTSKRQTEQSHKQVLVRKGTNKKFRLEVMSAICKFFYHAGVPLQAANSIYFHKMLELVGQYGPGLVPPRQLIYGRFLQEEIITIKSYLVDYKASWAVTGCSVMADSWKDGEGRTSINFLVSCPHGVYFVSSVDVTDIIEDGSKLFKLLDKVVEEIGEENVVQVITENTPSYRVAGKMLEDKRRHLFWTPCATFCIDRMLEDFLKIRPVEECMEKGQKITKFIYNQNWLLNVMKNDFTQGQEVLRPAVTRHASSFATLQSLLDHRTNLRRMFASTKWVSCGFSKSGEGKEVEKIILNSTFWKKVQYVRKSVDPIMQVLQKVNSSGSFSISSIYNDMYRAKLAIKSIHGDDVRKYGPFWNVIDHHWNSLFYHPLYMAAYFLNPSYRYRPDFVALQHSEVVRGLNESIVRLEPDSSRRISASMQISDYNSAKADFGTELAITTRTELDPAAWWQQHGISCLELQRLAVRILSQTCSSFGCEHNWSIFDQIRNQRHNRLARKKVNDLVYVHYNLRLREHQLMKRSNNPVSLDNILQERLLDDWIVESEKQVLQEDEDVICNQMEHVDVYENDLIDYEDGGVEGRKECLQLVTLGSDAETLDVNPMTNANVGASSADNINDLKFYGDDMSD